MREFPVSRAFGALELDGTNWADEHGFGDDFPTGLDFARTAAPFTVG